MLGRKILLYKDYIRFKKLSKHNPRSIVRGRFIVSENTTFTSFDTHYVYHPAWAARILAETKPAAHVDISSTLHFSSMVSAFIPVRFYDYRPANLRLSDLHSEKADLMSLPFDSNSVESLSCMHTVEHIGLGRYGDPLDPDGDTKAMTELKRVVKPGGTLLFVVPVGKPKVMFNAHRIYGYEEIKKQFDGFTLKNFYLVPDNAIHKGPIDNATAEDVAKQSYGCGCFWFVKC
jgi:SAM-dependent methyltransferase